MKDILRDIRTKIKNGAYSNEKQVRFSLVARILQALGTGIEHTIKSKY